MNHEKKNINETKEKLINDEKIIKMKLKTIMKKII